MLVYSEVYLLVLLILRFYFYIINKQKKKIVSFFPLLIAEEHMINDWPSRLFPHAFDLCQNNVYFPYYRLVVGCMCFWLYKSISKHRHILNKDFNTS